MTSQNSLWQKAASLADATPDSRNRYVDFLRAASIMVVVLGHWLVAAPYFDADGSFVPGHMLAIAPWTQWLTLALQVMPIFFLVGGYANAVAWRAAKRRGTSYRDWLGGRLQRLMTPVLPVLIAWIGASTLAVALGAPSEFVGLITQAALVPTWFLAVYVMVGVLVPLTHYAWQRYGFKSFAALVACAAAIDAVLLNTDVRSLGLLNYAFVWLAVHQLGYAWLDGRLRFRLGWAAAGATALTLLVTYGPYPLAMVGVPGEEFGNTGPPTLALLALGIAQTGLVLRLEPFARRMLASHRAWTSTVLVNGMIMTLYLWHMTAMVAALAIAFALGGAGLDAIPDSATWWQLRPLWLSLYAVTLVPFVALAARFERPRSGQAAPSRRRLVLGASLACCGLGMISDGGIVAAQGFRALPSLLPLIGSGIAGFGPFALRKRTARVAA